MKMNMKMKMFEQKILKYQTKLKLLGGQTNFIEFQNFAKKNMIFDIDITKNEEIFNIINSNKKYYKNLYRMLYPDIIFSLTGGLNYTMELKELVDNVTKLIAVLRTNGQILTKSEFNKKIQNEMADIQYNKTDENFITDYYYQYPILSFERLLGAKFLEEALKMKDLDYKYGVVKYYVVCPDDKLDLIVNFGAFGSRFSEPKINLLNPGREIEFYADYVINGRPVGATSTELGPTVMYADIGLGDSANKNVIQGYTNTNPIKKRYIVDTEAKSFAKMDSFDVFIEHFHNSKVEKPNNALFAINNAARIFHNINAYFCFHFFKELEKTNQINLLGKRINARSIVIRVYFPQNEIISIT